MEKNESQKNSQRKESISSSKSDEASKSESESLNEPFIQIKKETSNTIIIEKKLFDILIKNLQNMNSFGEKIKKIYNKNQSTFKISLIDEFSIISINKVNNEKKKEAKENNLDIKNDKNKNDINNNNTTNKNTSMMNLLLNSQKEREEISKLKLTIDEMKKKHEKEIDNYKLIIKELSNKIDTLEKEMTIIKEKNEKINQKKNLNKIEVIYSNQKLLSKIIDYLENQDKFNLSQCNSSLYQKIYFKALSQKIYKKLKDKEKILEKFEQEDVSTKFDIKENEISELFKNYIINQKVSGIEMRNEIVNSLIFLETHVKIPLANLKDPIGEKENLFNIVQPKKEKFFSKFFSALKSEFKEDIGINNPKEKRKNSFIQFTPKEYVNIFDTDRHVLETFKTDKSLNVKFNYENADKIKEIINEFFTSQLPQASFQKFISKICETYSDLLYSSFLALNDIKNLEIIVYALYCRYMKFKLKIEDLMSIIEDLNHFADSSRQIKQMLTKSKNELEFKYTNSIMTISQLNNIITSKEEEIKIMNLNLKEKEEKYEKFKNKIIKEYNNIKDEFKYTKQERDFYAKIFNEIKNFFIKVVTSELLI